MTWYDQPPTHMKIYADWHFLELTDDLKFITIEHPETLVVKATSNTATFFRLQLHRIGTHRYRPWRLA